MTGVSGRWRLGLALAACTAILWATLPIALKAALEVLDFRTLTWFRFLTAALATLAWLRWRGQLAGLGSRLRLERALFGVAAIGLIGNYVLFLLGLIYTTPANAQLLIQLAPLLLALGAVWLFRERVNRWQVLGFVGIAAGLLGFFFDQQQRQPAAHEYLLGVLLIVVAACCWAVYGLAQKALLQKGLQSQQILLVVYVVAALALWPLASPARLLELDAAHWGAAAYCCFNTVAAYGAFAEAMAHWEAARVSAVLALTPLLTLAAVSLAQPLLPQILRPESLGKLGLLAAAAVVAGSMLASLARRSVPISESPK